MGECYWHGLPVDPDFGCSECARERIKNGKSPIHSNRVHRAITNRDKRWAKEDKEYIKGIMDK